MLERVYSGLRKIPSALEDERYRFHKGISGLHSLPNSVEEFYALACCDEVYLDYMNFTFSAARSLVHLLNHQEAVLDSVLFPPENYFDTAESKAFGEKEKVSLFDTTIWARIIKNRLCENMVESQRTRKPDCLISTFNEAMRFYMENLLPEIGKIYKISANHLENNRPEYIREYSRKMRNSTPTS